MRRINPREIKKQAAAALAERQVDYRRLVFQHAAISLGFSMLLWLISLLVDHSIVDTQGLAGLGTASILKTVYVACMLAVIVLQPFWEAGILHTSVRVARRQNTEFSMLTRGFHRFGPMLRYFVLYLLILFIIAIFCFNIVAIPFLCRPVPQELMTAMESLDFTDASQIAAFETEYTQQIMSYSMPVIIGYFLLYIVAVILMNYRFCMIRYLLLDENRIGALAAFAGSIRMTKGERKNLFLLDLSFWWYYALTALITGIMYVPDILVSFGVTLPVTYETANAISYLVYLAAFLALTWFAGAYYQTSMAFAYEALHEPAKETA